jgi:multicomponent Na+:H+ antiporter subunit F
MILQTVIYFFIGSSVVSMVRVLAGPTTADRMIGLNMVSAQILALLVLIALSEQRSIYLDVALVYDIFGFVGLLAVTRYFAGREKAERGKQR